MKTERTTVIVLCLVLALVSVCGCSCQADDENDIQFLTSQEHYSDITQVNATISNLSPTDIEISGVADLVVYTKKQDGWMPNAPCASSIILDTEKRVISSGSTWELGKWVFTAKTCIPPGGVPSVDVGTYLFALEYRIPVTNTETVFVVYSNEFQVKNARSIRDFEVTVVNPSLLDFDVRNDSDQPIWFISQCAAEKYEVLNSDAPYVPYRLQRLTNAGTWEVFHPPTTECLGIVEPTMIEAGQMLSIEARGFHSQTNLTAGQYRWEVVIFPDWDPLILVAQPPSRHIFSPIFK